MIALVDCNSFYASCEQVFRPDLWGKPVVVLSNNDGCIIAANKQAKALTHIPLFEPVFKIKKVLAENNITCFSSNYTLYGEMSQRVVNILNTFSPLVEVYSIDESFLNLNGMADVKDYDNYGEAIKQSIYKQTGLPVGVGIAPTKVLAKLANRIAKKRTDETNQVYVIDTEEKRIEALKSIMVKDVWGIGRRHAERLNKIGVTTAYQFTQLPVEWVRNHMTVVGERIWKEMHGESAIEFMVNPKLKKNIGTAKSFGKRIENLDLIEEACAYYITEVAEVLRSQNTCATYVQLFLHTNYHSTTDKQYSKSITVTLQYPTNSTFQLISQAKKGLYAIYKPGYRYKKVGVCLSGIVPQHCIQGNLFTPQKDYRDVRLTEVLDKLNSKFGKSTVASGAIGTRKKEWELIKEERSPRYTTQWHELLTVKA
ncbi:Y-family DNA polymerase [Winogradskyella sp. A3E31]|uniref:Y-family DNA polymerase n=1 Tax=Winogradskyella sp. A3E31 TaxID=3349637 RepID=UPI00398AD2F0